LCSEDAKGLTTGLTQNQLIELFETDQLKSIVERSEERGWVDPAELDVFMPEPDGLTLDEVEAAFEEICERSLVVGAGVTALAPDERNVEPITRLTASLGL
jgi:hypothetical protein